MIYNFFCFFFIYAFLGWCLEVCYAAAEEGKFVNRGFLNGPVCPIYGIGMTLVIYILMPLKENVFILLIGSIALTSILEYLTGFVLEKIFHQKWWDYSNKPFNLSGYICLSFSLLWGFACLLIMNVFHPLISGLVSALPQIPVIILLLIFSSIMLIDTIVTVCAMFNINKAMHRLESIADKLKAFSAEFGEKLSEGTIDATQMLRDAEKITQQRKDDFIALIKEKEILSKKYGELGGRLQKAFPDLHLLKKEKNK